MNIEITLEMIQAFALVWWWVIPAYVVFSALLWAATWVIYLATMGVIRSHPVLFGTPARLGGYIVKTGEFLSTALNWLVFTLLLLELPKERFLSARLARHFRSGKGWRQKFAGWMGRTWLDPFDPSGRHI